MRYLTYLFILITCLFLGCNSKASLPDSITVKEISRNRECTPYIVMFFSLDSEFQKVDNIKYPDDWPMEFTIPEHALVLQNTPRAYTANQGTLPVMDVYFLSKYRPAEIREMILSEIDLDDYSINEVFEEPHRWILGVNSLSFALHPKDDNDIESIIIETRFGTGLKSGYTVTSIRVKQYPLDGISAPSL